MVNVRVFNIFFNLFSDGSLSDVEDEDDFLNSVALGAYIVGPGNSRPVEVDLTFPLNYKGENYKLAGEASLLHIHIKCLANFASELFRRSPLLFLG